MSQQSMRARERHALVRPTEGRLLAGVATGVAQHLEVPVWAVRLLLALLVSGGVGVLAYVALWVLVPAEDAAVETPFQLWPPRWLPPPPRGRSRRSQLIELAAWAVLGGALATVFQSFGFPFGGGGVLPLTLAGIGALLIWKRAPDAQREHWAGEARRYSAVLGTPQRRGILIVGGGALLVVAGVTAFLAAHDALAQARAGAVAIAATFVGVMLVAGPWLLRLARELTAERRARIRAQERAEVAAQLHDSVLQTLALLQARAGDPAAVRRLARQQERHLRQWLYDPAPAGAPTTLAGELRAVCADVEDDHGVSISVVFVGDTALDPPVRALVAATREALVNAAKASGASEIAVFAEVTGRRAEVWVRDRGAGFDPDQVPADRHGIRESIIGRMTRHGGEARVRSTPGAGTEVMLLLPLARS
jgi:signal transduction histidine kinase/phage shock protein PspC (stress-responsive transcriptional regulator)